MISQQVDMFQNLSFARKDGTYSLWDHQNFIAELRLPKDFKPAINLNAVLRDYYSWSEELQRERLTVLKVIGDAVCSNEQQLRRYLKSIMSYSQTSAHINFLRKRGFVQRYKCYLDGDIDENGERVNIPTPAPINLGPAGYTLMSYLYNEDFFMDAEAWLGSSRDATIQRFVAMNEIRCCFAEMEIARDWKWYPTIGGQRGYKKPLAIMQIGEVTNEEDGRAWMIFERAQLKQNFLGFFKDRLNLYRHIYEKHGFIPVSNTPNDGEKIVVLSCSSLNVANVIQEEIGLQKYPFTIWVLVDEWFDTDEAGPVTHAFATTTKKPEGYALQRLKLNL